MAVSKQKPTEPNPLFLDWPNPTHHPIDRGFFGANESGLFAIGKELPWSMFTKGSTQSANQIVDHLLEKADGVVWYGKSKVKVGLGMFFFG